MKNRKYLCCLLLMVMLTGFFGLFACKSRQIVVVTIITNNFLEIEPLKGKSGAAIDFEVPKLEDNDFEGFYMDGEHTHYFGKTIKQFPENDITLYAKYNPHALYKIFFESAGGTYVKSLDIFIGESLSEYKPQDPTKHGNIFAGWIIKNESEQGYALFDFDTEMPQHNITLYADWIRDPSKDYYKFIIDNKIYKEEIVEPNTVLSPCSPKMDAGYIFEDWYVDPLSATKFGFETAVNFNSEEALLDADGAYCIYGNYYSQGIIVKDGAVTGYSGNANKIVIPWAMNGFLIQEIADEAFAFQKFKSISLPETIKIIGSRAFYNCLGLLSLSLPSSVEIIGAEAFSGCSLLKDITVPKKADININDAFGDCDSLIDISIEDGHSKYLSYQGGIYSLDGLTLIKCASGLTDYIVAEGTVSIAAGAFDSKMLKTLSIPDSVTNIEKGAIKYENSTLNELTLPAIANSRYIKDGQTVPIFNLATVFGAEKYSDNMGSSIYLNSLYVPSSLTSVTLSSVSAEFSYSFYGCFYIKKIILPTNGLTYIGAGAFYSCYNLEEIFIPDSVTDISGGSIDKAAFYYCQNLKKITLPFLVSDFLSYIFGAKNYKDSINAGGSIVPYTFFLEDVVLSAANISELKNGAFYGNKSLKRIAFNSQIKKLGYECFYNCNMLEQIDSLDYVEELLVNSNNYSGVFAYCYNLENLLLPKLNKGIIGKDAFLGAGSFGGTFSFSVGEGVVAIEDYAFMDCTSLADISIASTVVYIGTGAFYNCAALKRLTVPQNVIVIGLGAFQGCNALELLEIPMRNNVEITASSNETISSFSLPNYFGSVYITGNKYLTGDSYSYYVPRALKTVSFNYCDDDISLHYSFYNCEFIESISLRQELTEIGENAFYGCTSLRSVNISESIKSIGNGTFSYCKNLTEFTVNSENTFFTVADGVLYSFDKSDLIFYPAGRRTESFSIPEGVTHINSFAFAGNAYLKNIVLPESLSSVGASIFQNCSGLVSVETKSGSFDAQSLNKGMLLNENKTVLFAYFGLDTEIIIPDTVKTIETLVFGNLQYINKIVIGKDVVNIGRFAFEGISAEIEFAPDNNIQTIGEYAFYGYLGKSIKLPSCVEVLSASVFENSALEEITLPQKLISIGDYAFFNNQSLGKLTVPDNCLLESIGAAAFALCGLKLFDIPDYLIDIGNYAFAYNNIEVFDSVDTKLETLGEYSFYCNSLQTVRISGKIKNISEGAFAYNLSLYSLFIGEGVQKIGKFAFKADTRPFGEENPLSMLNNIRIPASVEIIDDYAFYGAGHYAFPAGENGLYWYLTQEVNLTFAENSRLTEIGNSAFDMMRLCDILDLSMTRLERIGAYSFANFVGSSMIPDNYSLKSVIFPQTLRFIGSYAFAYQVSMQEVYIPSSVEALDESAFYYCPNLTKIIIGDNEQNSL